METCIQSRTGSAAADIGGGVYVLWLHLSRAQNITIGRLGTYFFQSGVYAYCGSAQNGLEKRLARHIRLQKILHWHIDYFRVYSDFLGNVLIYDQPKSAECLLTRELLRIPSAFFPVPGFGSSDCRCCSHLVYVPLAIPRVD